MRLIDADALIECIKDELYDNSSYWYKLIADALIKCIQDQPTIDAEPAQIRLGSEANGCWIKCKDCANTRCSRRVNVRTYNADEVDELFNGCTNPLHPTEEDRHKAYARLMLRTLK